MLTLVLGLLAVAGAPDGWAEARVPEPEPDPAELRTPMRGPGIEPVEPLGPLLPVPLPLVSLDAVAEAPLEAPAAEPSADAPRDADPPAADPPDDAPPAAEPPEVEPPEVEPPVATSFTAEPPTAEAPDAAPLAATPPCATPSTVPIFGRGPRRARASAGGLVLELHSDFGFARLVRIEFSDHRRATLSLNDGISFALGWSFLPLADGRLGTRASVGFKVDRLRASNGSAVFTAFPVDLMEALHAGPLRLGAGASVLLAPRVGGSGFLEGERTSFAPAPGAVLDAEWLVSSRGRAGIGVRASWYRFASSTFVRGAPSIGLLLRADLDMRSP